ncbi:hypothetical protein ACWGB8_27670 [Kitasatospora sp. NPDC054939]
MRGAQRVDVGAALLGVHLDYAKYAELLLNAGPSARKGMEDIAGTPAYHLTGRLTVDQIAAIDPRTHRAMTKEGMTAFDPVGRQPGPHPALRASAPDVPGDPGRRRPAARGSAWRIRQ